MNVYQRSVELGLTGTDAEKVSVLQCLTVSNIPVSSVRTWFREQNLWLQRSTGSMFGPLQDAYALAPQQSKDKLDYLYDTVFAGSAEFLRTTDPFWAVKVFQLVQLVVSLAPQASGLVDSFYALDGGRPFKDLTVQQYAASQTEYEQQQAARDALAAIQQRRQAWDAIAADIRSRIESGALTDNASILAAVQAAL